MADEMSPKSEFADRRLIEVHEFTLNGSKLTIGGKPFRMARRVIDSGTRDGPHDREIS